MSKRRKNEIITSEQAYNRLTTRSKEGRFLPGTTGNPGGRPKSAIEMRDLARASAVDALMTLVHIMRTGKPLEQVQACKMILERAYGRPVPSTEENESSELIPSICISLSKIR